MIEYILIIFLTANGQMQPLMDQHNPFDSEQACNAHAVEQAIPEIKRVSRDDVLMAHVCIPVRVEVV